MILLASIIISLALVSGQCQAGWQADTTREAHNPYCPLVAELGPQSDSFRAAVLEHRRSDEASIEEAVAKNLKVFEEVARLARNHSVNILVFPEDGLFVGPRKFMEPALEEIPDPQRLAADHRNPCLEAHLFEGCCAKLIRFSCMARENQMYIVANYGTRQSCVPREKVLDSVCPEEGFFVLNTNIVLDQWGNYIGRYRKYNLFLEYFDKAPSLERLYFDSPYGRFGVFTCFDIMFKRPAVELVEKYHIDTAVFPTWWYDELPLLTAIQFQDAWSATNGVNLLASNIQRRSLGSVGSSIFGGLESVYTNPDTAQSKLLVATLLRKPRQQHHCAATNNFNPATVVVNAYPDYDYTFKQYTLMSNDSIHTLRAHSHSLELCSGSKVCCRLTYTATQDTQAQHLAQMALVVRDAPRRGYYNWYEQLCALVTVGQPLEAPHMLQNLNDTSFVPSTQVKFNQLSLEGTFETSHVFPVSAYNITRLIERSKRTFNCRDSATGSYRCQLNYTGEPGVEIYSFALYGRVYERDQMPEGW